MACGNRRNKQRDHERYMAKRGFWQQKEYRDAHKEQKAEYRRKYEFEKRCSNPIIYNIWRKTTPRTNSPQLTDIPEFLQGDNWFQEDTTGLYLDFTKPYQPPRWTLSHDGVPFAKLGDLHVISGKAGTRQNGLDVAVYGVSFVR